jgi:hypothetical protein
METVEATQPTVAIEPVGVSPPFVAADLTGGAQPTAGVEAAIDTEPCAHCGAPLARDQRYCLECGTPRTYLSGMLIERLQGPSAQPAQPVQPSPAPWQRGNVLTLIAGIGVLLLAMGVGVLIGRSGSSGAAGAAAPQVIVATPTTGAAGAAGTPTPQATSTTPTTATKIPAAKPKAKTAQPSGVGSVPSKPAPPAVLKNLHTGGSGGSYEQKSKNLPNVVETG